MAGTTTKKKATAKKTVTKAKAPKTKVEESIDIVEEPVAEVDEPIVPKQVDVNQAIPVYNGYQGWLIYKSPRSGEKIEWSEFGEEQPVELRELRIAKASNAKEFFVNNWFMFDDEYQWVIDYLGVRRYYKNAIPLEAFDEVFEKTPAEAKATIEGMSIGQRKSLEFRARQLIESGDIDSRKMIAALEEAFGTELILRADM